ncbi:MULTISPECIES: xanthine dehydrogenase accessory protein XdhC [unclassified Mesorhizobium]|uniref:xanthine dehydrogenase accessory protein XdhC n=1 Tax=unclassified Mesorhizobium TaxID=325217 RepID=UPI003014CC35
MTRNAESLRAFFDVSPAVALVEVAEAKGSTPREAGTKMLVSPDAIFGTIGGGQLEFMAIDKAREMLAEALLPPPCGEGGPEGRVGVAQNGANPLPPQPRSASRIDPPRKGEGIVLDIPLGPEIGQCCGGRVNLSIRLVDDQLRQNLIEEARIEDARSPHIYLFGGGHVGHALASAFSLLPVHVVVVETRADALDGMPEAIETRLTPMPEEMVREAPAGAAFVVLTHDHALDFLIVAEALKRDDAAYVGMIGSKTKKATFKSWYLKTANGTEEAFARLVSPIGGDAVKDKRPAVIAAMAAAEIMMALVR